MLKKRTYLQDKQTERGQSTITIALSLSVLLLLIIGAVVLCMALFTASTMEDYDKGDGLYENNEMQSSLDVTPHVFALNSNELRVLPAQFDILFA